MEKELDIEGSLRQVLRNKPIPGANISMVIIDTAASPIFQYVKTDKAGRFGIHDIQFTGTRRLIVSAADAKDRQRGYLKLDSILQIPPEVEPFKFVIQPHQLSEITETTPAIVTDQTGDELVATYLSKQLRMRDTIHIKEVTVRANKRNTINMQDGLVRMYGFPDKAIDVKDYPIATDLGQLLNMAGMGSTGFYASGSCPNLVFRSRRGPISYLSGSGAFLVLLNGTEMPPDEICSIPIAIIERVELVGDGPAMAIYGARSIVGVVSIFTKDNVYFLHATPPYTVARYLEGYYDSRVFYSPVLNGKDPIDPRTTTILWEPDVITDTNGMATLSFYTTDRKTHVNVEAEGITLTGTPFSSGTKYVVK